MQDMPEDIQPGLLLSYEDLPPHLKQCFVYCSLFPEDFNFNRNELVYMWIAEGFIKKEEEMKMEESAEEYYNELLMRNLLQAIPPFFDGSRCKMHDLLRSLAIFVSQNQHIYAHHENFHSSGSIRSRHLSFIGKEMNSVPEEIMEQNYVRTLLLSRNPRINSISFELLRSLNRLRVLDLNDTGIETLPNSLGDLIHLRFLNISQTKLRKLPDSIENLKNLETLIAFGLNLSSLPIEIVKLYNLRCLVVRNQLDSMPIGLDNLKKLRVISCFVVNEGSSSTGSRYTSNMKELRNLCQLTDLSIHNLERVSSKEEAKEAAMENKTSLKCLRLRCSSPCETQPHTYEKIEKIGKVFAGIRIPENLRELQINGFFGKELPSHMTSRSLGQLTMLRLVNCELVKQLPFLGDIPKLQTLHIVGASSIVKLGSEFLGSLKFPTLQDLLLARMNKLEWMFKVEPGAFPCLEKLFILECSKLKSLSEGLQHATCLKLLIVEYAENVESIENLSSISELKIERNSRLRYVKNLPSLKIMKIKECFALKDVQNVGELSYLSISDVEMKTLPEWLKKTIAPKKMDVRGSVELVLRIYQNAEDWNFIKKCFYVEVGTYDRSKYISYRKEPYRYNSNLTGSSGASSSSVTITEDVNDFMDKE